MNDTSACDHCGNVAREEDGKVWLAFPGAPGCTTTGAFTELPVWECATDEKTDDQRSMAVQSAQATPDGPCEDSPSHLRSDPQGPNFGANTGMAIQSNYHKPPGQCDGFGTTLTTRNAVDDESVTAT